MEYYLDTIYESFINVYVSFKLEEDNEDINTIFYSDVNFIPFGEFYLIVLQTTNNRVCRKTALKVTNINTLKVLILSILKKDAEQKRVEFSKCKIFMENCSINRPNSEEHVSKEFYQHLEFDELFQFIEGLDWSSNLYNWNKEPFRVKYS